MTRHLMTLGGLLVAGCAAGALVDPDGGAVDAGLPASGEADAGPADGGGVAGGPDAGEGTPLPPCRCDRVIAPSETTVDLSGLDAGAEVCLRPTSTPRGPLTLRGLAGTAAAPIVIRNCDARVEIVSTTTTRALSLTGHHFRVTGAGAPGVEYGLHLQAALAPAIVQAGRCDHFELDHLELDRSGFAGIMAKVDPSSSACDVGDRRFDPFVMDGVHLHHLFIHDTDGEGVYLGNSFYGGAATQYCGGNPACDGGPCGGKTQYPHEVRHARLDHLRVERTGWDGIQVGSAVEDCVIADNVVVDYGTANVASQNHGLQVGAGSSCAVLRNRLERGHTAMNLQGLGGTDVVNNLILGFDEVGAIVNPRPAPLPTDVVPKDAYLGGYRVVHNTFVSSAATAIPMRDVNVPTNPVPGGNVLANNFVVHGGASWTLLTTRYGWVESGNLRGASNDFVEAGVGDYCLRPGAAGVDAASAASLTPADDLRGQSRPLGAGPDVGALECR